MDEYTSISFQHDCRWQDAINRLDGAYNASTLRSYRRSFVRFASWCRERHVPYLPAAPSHLAQFIDDLSDSLRPVSLGHVARAIGRIHSLAGEADPTHSSDVFLSLRRAARRNAYAPRQAFGLTIEILARMAQACPDDLRGYRDRTLMWVGFETLCRASEIAALKIEDVTRTSRGTVTIVVRRGKSDQLGRGRTVVLSASTAQVVEAWIGKSGRATGLLFPRTNSAMTPVGSLAASSITRILRAGARRAGLPHAIVAQISSHSLRVGGAQQLTMNERNLSQIMRAGGWKSIATVSRYIEGAQLSPWDGNANVLSFPLPLQRRPHVKGWR